MFLCELAADEAAIEVDLHHLVPLRGIEILDGPVDPNPRGEDENVDPAPLGRDPVEDRLHLLPVGNIAGRLERFAAGFLDRAVNGLDRAFAEIVDHHSRAFGREPQRGGASDVAGGAGDDCHFSFKSHSFSPQQL
jgi:hypothetical protein